MITIWHESSIRVFTQRKLLPRSHSLDLDKWFGIDGREVVLFGFHDSPPFWVVNEQFLETHHGFLLAYSYHNFAFCARSEPRPARIHSPDPFLRAYASVSLHHARGACHIVSDFGNRCELGKIKTPCIIGFRQRRTSLGLASLARGTMKKTEQRCSVFFYFLQERWNFFEIIDKRRAHAAVVERGCGMIEREEYLLTDIIECPAECLAVRLGNLFAGDEMSQRVPPEGDDDFRPDDPYLRMQPGHTRIDFFGRRISIFRRPVLHDIGDVDIFAFQVDRREHLREKLSRRSHERLPLQIFVFSRRFADEHYIRIRAALPRHRPCRLYPKRARTLLFPFGIGCR